MKKQNEDGKTRERLHRIREFLRKIVRCVAACVAIFKDSSKSE